MPPAVSIIMPAYKVTRYITTALDSIFVQTFQDFEVIVVNDGCPDTDNLEQAIKPYRSRIEYIRQENGGVGAARQAAVLAAKAPVIAQLDPDDWWKSEYLEIQLKLLESHPGVDLIYPNGFYFGDRALDGKQLMDFLPSDGDVTFRSLMENRVNIIYSSVIRKETILRTGNFDSALRTSEDFDLWIRILKGGGKIVYHRTPLLCYRLRNGSLTSSSVDLQTWMLKVLEKTEATQQLSEEEKTALTTRKTAIQMEMELASAKDAIRRKSWADARWHLELYSHYRPSRKLTAVRLLLRCYPQLLGAVMSSRDMLLKTGLVKARRPQSA